MAGGDLTYVPPPPPPALCLVPYALAQPETQAAYDELSITEAQKLLRLPNRAELEAFVIDKHPEWEMTADKIIFSVPETSQKSAEIPSMRLIAECLSYATELERIV